MSAESEIAKIREEIKEIKRLHKILESYAEGVSSMAAEFNEARKKDIAKLAGDLKTLSATVASKGKK